MYRLHSVPDWASFAVHLALADAGHDVAERVLESDVNALAVADERQHAHAGDADREWSNPYGRS